MATALNEAPTMPLKLDWDVSGPLAGVLGMQQLGTYQDNVARQARDSDLANAEKQLEYDTKVKDVPLKDAERANKLKQEEVVKTLYDKGILNDQMETTSKAAIQTNLAKMDEAQRTMMENKAYPWAVLAAGMPSKADDPAAQAKYEQVRQHAKTVYNIDLPNNYDPQIAQMIQQKGAMSALALKQKWHMDEQYLKADTAETVARIGAGSRVDAASIASNTRGSEAAKTLTELRSKDTLTTSDILRGLEAVQNTRKEDDYKAMIKEVTSSVNTEVMKLSNQREVDSKAADVGLKPGLSKEALARALVEKRMAEEEAKSFSRAFADKGIRLPNGETVKADSPTAQVYIQRLAGGSPVSLPPVVTGGTTPVPTPQPEVDATKPAGAMGQTMGSTPKPTIVQQFRDKTTGKVTQYRMSDGSIVKAQ